MLEIALAGLWGEVWRYGLGGALIIGCLAAAYFSPVFKKDFLWAAGVIGVFMIAFAIGVTTGERRVRAQWEAAKVVSIKAGKEARVGAERTIDRAGPRGLRNDRYDRDRRP